MTHEDAGHYGAKHPSGTAYSPQVADALKEKAHDGRITCAAAHEVATSLGVTPAEVGKTSDLLEYRLIECQLGLFGYSPQRRIVKPAEEVSDELRERLARATRRGKISCAACWRIADALGLEKIAVSAACETLTIKIVHCQLGAF